MTDRIDRSVVLTGNTYKLRSPNSPHAVYVTINDDGERIVEVFANSKGMEEFEMTTALLRLVSALLQDPHNHFLPLVLDELSQVYSPRGGYHVMEHWARDGNDQPWVNGIVHHIGVALAHRAHALGLVDDPKAWWGVAP